MTQPRHGGFFQDYTRDLTTDDLHRLFTRDTRDAYRFFARHIDFRQFANLPWYRRLPAQARVLFVAFTMRMSPARRAVYALALDGHAGRACSISSAAIASPMARAGCCSRSAW